MKNKIPSPRIEEKEVDNVIASFGIKPQYVDRENLHSLLKKQKEQFLVQERAKGKEHNR